MLARRFLVRTWYWAARVGALAIGMGTVLAHRAQQTLFSPHGGAPAAAALPIQRELRVHPPRLYGSVTIGMEGLSWHLKPRGLYGFPGALVRDGVPFAEINGVGVTRVGEQGAPLVAAGVPAPPGPAVVVRTRHREAFVAVDDADGFAACSTCDCGWRPSRAGRKPAAQGS